MKIDTTTEIVYRRRGDGWIGHGTVCAGIELSVSVVGRTRNGRLYPYAFSSSLRRSDGGGQISLLLDRRCVSLTNATWQIRADGGEYQIAELQRKERQ